MMLVLVIAAAIPAATDSCERRKLPRVVRLYPPRGGNLGRWAFADDEAADLPEYRDLVADGVDGADATDRLIRSFGVESDAPAQHPALSGWRWPRHRRASWPP